MSSQPPLPADGTSHYRRGAVMGMTMAEAFVLITFALLLLLALWKVQDDQERQVYQVVDALSPEELAAAADLQESGQLQAVSELVAQGADFRTPETTPATIDRWRLIDKDELHRLLNGVEELPEDLQRDLADLVEIEGSARLRQLLDLNEREIEDELATLSNEDLAQAAVLRRSGQLEAITDLVQGGADFRAPETTPATLDNWRLVEDQELRELFDQVEALPPDLQSGLGDLLAAEPQEGVAELLRYSEREALEALDQLQDEEIADALSLSQSGQLEAITDLVERGADFRAPETTPATRDNWRLLDDEKLRRLFDDVEALPPTLQSGLGNLLATEPENEVAELLRYSERDTLEAFDQLQDEEIADALSLSQSGQLGAITDLVEGGADFRAPETTPATRDNWRIVEGEGLQRLLDGMEAVPAPLQTALADLIESEDAERIAKLIEAGADTTGEAELEERLAGIGRRLASAKEEAQTLVRSLREELGTSVSAVGGMIDDNGAIVLPDTVLFEQGSAQITPVMRDFLNAICEPWLRELMTSPAPVVSARIEGHASSEWRQGTSPDEAYLNNLALSQARSQAVLDSCLRIVSSAEIRSWAHAHLAAVGYSSGQPILVNGAEDPSRSRRVVFSMALDDDKLLEDVASDVAIESDAADDAGHAAFR